MASMHRRLACDGEAGGGGAAGAWRPQAAPARRAGNMKSVTITVMISEKSDIREL